MILRIVLALALVACSSKNKQQSTTGGTSTGGASSGGDSTNTYLSTLPAWPAASADANAATGAGVDSYVTGGDNLTYRCTTTPYSITTTPDQIVTFDPTADVLWPGALIQGASYQAGTLSALPLTQRAPLTVSIPTLLFAGNSEVVQAPTEATVESAVGDIVGAAAAQNIAASSSISYSQTTAYSTDQAAAQLGFSVSYLGGSAEGSLALSDSSDLHSVVGSFIQNMFTVTVPQPEHPGDLFSGLSDSDLQDAISAGQLGPNNLPVYVASVTYGRIMMFSITSRASTEEIQAALNAQYSGVVVDGSVSAAYSDLLTNGSTVVHVAAIGGDPSNAEAMIKSGVPSEFFDSNPSISTGVPISYVLRNLGDNSIAALSQTTSYNVQTCTESVTGAGANIYILNDTTNAANHLGSVLTYDATGATNALTDPIATATDDQYYYDGIAWDSADDEIFVIVDHNLSPGNDDDSILAYNADGSTVSPSGAFDFIDDFDPTASDYHPAALSYDPKYDHLFLAIEMALSAGTDLIETFTPDGNRVGSSAIRTTHQNITGVAYAPTTDQIYACFDYNPSYIEYFKRNGDPGTVSGSFSGLTDAREIVYDGQHDWLYVADGSSSKIFVFDTQGNLVGTAGDKSVFPSSVSSVAYDSVNDHIIGTSVDDGTVAVFATDAPSFTEVDTGNGAFQNVSKPIDVIFRP